MAVVTISRQYGSYGDEIAHRLCVILGYRYFDKKLICSLAAELGLVGEDIVDFTEDGQIFQTFLDQLVGRTRRTGQVRVWQQNPNGTRMIKEQVIDSDCAMRLVQAAILEAYKDDGVVIVGRGGQAILKDKLDVLHVRIEAPWDQRIQYVEEHEKVNRVVAQELLIKKDNAAADYLRHFYKIEWDDPTLYHLVINTGKCGVESAAQLIHQGVNLLIMPVAS